MTKLETARLHEMQKANPTRPTVDSAMVKLWVIGDTAKDTDKPIGHICSYQAMITAIMVNPYIQADDKSRAITVFEKWAYNNGRQDERRATGCAINVSWYEDPVETSY